MSARFRAVAKAIVIALVAVIAADVAAIAADNSTDQCSLPISERSGGWYCYDDPQP